MKNKIIIYSLSLLSLFMFTGCANNSQQSLTSLQNQVKRVESIISDSSDDISSVSPATTYSTTYSSIQQHKANSYNNMVRENQIKSEVLDLNTTVKSCLQGNLKIGKTRAESLKKLSSNISKNLSKYNETKNEIKSSIKSIKQNLKIPKLNTFNAESDYISLNGNMNERYIYLCNIYDNLEQAYILICDQCFNKFQNDIENNDSNNFNNITQSPSIENNNIATNKNSRFRKNIDSYAPASNNDSKTKISENSEEITNKDFRNIDSFTNQKPPIANNSYYNNPYYNQTAYGNPYNNFNNPYGYNNAYGAGYGYRYGRYNPNRNTDTFYPYNRNVDSYRTLPLEYPVSNINDNSIKKDKESTNEENLKHETPTKKDIENEKLSNIISNNNTVQEIPDIEAIEHTTNKMISSKESLTSLTSFSKQATENAKDNKPIKNEVI